MTRPPPIDELAKIVHRGKDLASKSAWYRFNRRVSLRLTSLVLRTDVSANQVSWTMLALAVLAGALASVDSSGAGFAAALLLYVSWLLDRVDGEVARARRAESWSGVYLDWIYHRLAPTLVHVGFLWRVYERHPSELHLGLLALTGICLLLIKENSEVAHNLFPRVKLAPPPFDPTEQTPRTDTPSTRLSLGTRLFELSSIYLSASGAAGIYAGALAIEAATHFHALCWIAPLVALVSLGFALWGTTRLATGGIDASINKLRRKAERSED